MKTLLPYVSELFIHMASFTDMYDIQLSCP